MDANLTFNSIVFKKNFDTESGSRRSSVARGLNIPDVMLIKSQGYTDSETKVSGTQHLIRFERHNIDAQGAALRPSIYAVIQVPSTAGSSEVTTLVTTFKAAIADADLITNVLNSES